MNSSYIPVIAAIIGALTGSLTTLVWQSRTGIKSQKKLLFDTLMANRGVAAWDDDFVKAINLIDTYYYKNTTVRRLCQQYILSLEPHVYQTGRHKLLFQDLLVEMAKDIDLKGLKATDIGTYYLPQRMLDQLIGTDKLPIPSAPYDDGSETPS